MAANAKKPHLLVTKARQRTPLSKRSEFQVFEGQPRRGTPTVVKKTVESHPHPRAVATAKLHIGGYGRVSPDIRKPRHLATYVGLDGRVLHVTERVTPLLKFRNVRGVRKPSVSTPLLLKAVPDIVSQLVKAREHSPLVNPSLANWGVDKEGRMVLMHTGTMSSGLRQQLLTLVQDLKAVKPKAYKKARSLMVDELSKTKGRKSAEHEVAFVEWWLRELQDPEVQARFARDPRFAKTLIMKLVKKT